MTSATLYTLQRFDWQFFGTLSFKSERLPERLRVSMWFALAREVARWTHVHFTKNLVWVLRMEAGEATGRLHFHYLLAGVPASFLCDKTCFAMMRQWEKVGGGIARVRLFEPTGDAVEYICKCLSGGSGGNLYEQTKFTLSDSELMFSNSCFRKPNLDGFKGRKHAAFRCVSGPDDLLGQVACI